MCPHCPCSTVTPLPAAWHSPAWCCSDCVCLCQLRHCPVPGRAQQSRELLLEWLWPLEGMVWHNCKGSSSGARLLCIWALQVFPGEEQPSPGCTGGAAPLCSPECVSCCACADKTPGVTQGCSSEGLGRDRGHPCGVQGLCSSPQLHSWLS